VGTGVAGVGVAVFEEIGRTCRQTFVLVEKQRVLADVALLRLTGLAVFNAFTAHRIAAVPFGKMANRARLNAFLIE